MQEDELQSAEIAEPAEGSESAPDSEGQHEEKVTFSEEQQAKVDEIIGEQTFKRRKTERELQEKLEAQAAELEELRIQVPSQSRPDIPALPDPYDDDYEAQIQARDEAIRKAAEFDASQNERQRLAEIDAERQQRAAEAALLEQAQTYSDRAVKLGITSEELQNAGQRVNSFGIDNELAQAILADEMGPAITKYLGDRPQELDAISRMGPRSLIMFSELKSKAAALSAKTSGAPPPVQPLEGGGMPQQKRGPAGLTIE